jgi:type I restriction enzyme R subunit
MSRFAESVLEEAILDYLCSLKWQVHFGPEIALGGQDTERGDNREVLLTSRLRSALERLNSFLPALRDVLLPRLMSGEVRVKDL